MIVYFFLGVLYISLGISFYYLYLDIDNNLPEGWYRPINGKEWLTHTVYVYLASMLGIVFFIVGLLLVIGIILIWPLITISYMVRMNNGNIIRPKQY